MKLTELVHPETGQTVEVDDDKTGPYLSQGWEKKTTTSTVLDKD